MTYPRGFRAVWGSIGVAALALLLYQAQQHQAPGSTPHASGAPQQTSRSAPGSPSVSPAGLATTPDRGAGAVVPIAVGRARSSGASTSSSSATPAPPTSTPTPTGGASPSTGSTPTAPSSPPSTPAPLLAASAAIALPARSASLEVRVGLAVTPAAPPFPLLPGVEASIGLPPL